MTAIQVPSSTRYASGIDAATFGEHRSRVRPVPASGFSGRLSADGSSGHLAEPHRYHLYGGWFCPGSQRAAIVLSLLGLTDLVSVSYVDGLRDGRGWAFRERTGPDAVNGFTLLRQAYETSDPGYDGNISVPVLWDKQARTIVSNDPQAIELDLATAFAGWAAAVPIYPDELRDDISDLSRYVADLDRCITRAVYFDQARAELLVRLRSFDRLLGEHRYLVGGDLTLADIRLWVILARYDASANATGAAGPPLTDFGNLWDYARDVYVRPAFQNTTNFAAFQAPLSTLADWSEPVETELRPTGATHRLNPASATGGR